LQTLAGLKKPCTSVTFNPTETAVLVGTESGVLRLFDVTALTKRACRSHRTRAHAGYNAWLGNAHDGHACRATVPVLPHPRVFPPPPLLAAPFARVPALRSFKGHKAGVLCQDWHPYMTSLAATGSADTLVMVRDWVHVGM
jgi:WD40 repeat protein